MNEINKTLVRISCAVLVGLVFGGVIAGYIDRKINKKSAHKPCGIYEAYFKRPIDFICGMLAIIVFWPLYLVVAIMVKVKLGSPVLFTQDRPGKDEKSFKLYKFRTMTNEKDENGDLLSDEIRLTNFGKWLRATSFDELPEAINIIKGDMSIIGPRPLLVKYLPYYNEEQHHRHDVKPGLSGYAQVHGRNTVNWEDKFNMDMEYLNNITFLGDLKILVETVFKAFIKQEGISSVTSATMEDFVDYAIAKQNGDI
ncbi:sugar transferase [Hungatella sp.]|jgi:undecaprenyl phosphate N,N'-diacetylbacillosamine 1-phosphate transferase|uniref:sugar transferase n=1 Tax=Hungatella sp. TaxID=2613924 RepID=UPI002A83B726|nr:sugar transferase [Hungatella sp.]